MIAHVITIQYSAIYVCHLYMAINITFYKARFVFEYNVYILFNHILNLCYIFKYSIHIIVKITNLYYLTHFQY